MIAGLHLETISDVPVLGVAEGPLVDPINRVLKRAVDIVGALVGLAISAPLLGVFGGLVYLESPGPIIYRQTRTGRRGRMFKILKIRSMRLDAEAQGGAQWAKKGDDRRLKIGAFMRATNIDEVPQFWSVLKGEMSLVGPRPERPELIAKFQDEIPHYNARHSVKPGMTGWAQIHGLRGDTDLTERVRYDLYYIENWTLLGDFWIMLKTFQNRQNAY
jgi:exopolysaccharide biosynthesis polyprenyl glycosylphosphotransferase